MDVVRDKGICETVCISQSNLQDVAVVTVVCSQLSWSHFRVLGGIDDPLKRDFYIELSQLEKWSVRQLKERVNSMLYERTALSRKPEEAIRYDLAQLRDEQSVSPDFYLETLTF